MSAEKVVHELAVEFRKTMKNQRETTQRIAEVSQEDREFIRCELASLGDFLVKNYGLTVKQVRTFLSEMLTVTI